MKTLADKLLEALEGKGQWPEGKPGPAPKPKEGKFFYDMTIGSDGKQSVSVYVDGKCVTAAAFDEGTNFLELKAGEQLRGMDMEGVKVELLKSTRNRVVLHLRTSNYDLTDLSNLGAQNPDDYTLTTWVYEGIYA